MEQRPYKKMFDEIKVSEARMKEIEKAMESCIVTKKRRSYKKFVVFAVAATLVLSFGVMASAQILEIVEEYFIKSKEIDYAVDDKMQDEIEEKGTIVSDSGLQTYAPNNIDLGTKWIAVTINGVPCEVDLDIEWSKYIDDKGKLKESVLNDKELSDFILGYNTAWLEKYIDEEGKLVVNILTQADPRNRIGWYYITEDDGSKYLAVPYSAEFDADVELTKIGMNSRGILIPELEEEEVVYYKFTYSEKRYAVALWWYTTDQSGTFGDGRCYWTEIIELEEN